VELLDPRDLHDITLENTFHQGLPLFVVVSIQHVLLSDHIV
jgi:hypothetical protein